MEKSTDNIVLIGMPGAGKSTVGVVLAKILNYQFMDTDLTIQEHDGRTLQEIIDNDGNDEFIRIEGEVLSGVEARHTVISTGGSAVYSDNAMQHLKSIGTVVYLTVSYEDMLKRLDNLENRGVVMKNGKGSSLSALYEEREPLYKQYADVIFDVNGMSITASATHIAEELLKMGKALKLHEEQ